MTELNLTGSSDSNESACNAGDLVSIPELERSPGGAWQPTPVFLPSRFHGQSSLVDYSSRGHKELDMTERYTRSVSGVGQVYGDLTGFFFFWLHQIFLASCVSVVAHGLNSCSTWALSSLTRD